MLDIIIQYILLFHSSLMDNLTKVAGKGKLFHFFKPGIRADRLTFFPYNLKPVAVGWIVAGSNHNPAIQLIVERGEIYHFRSAETDIVNMNSSIGKSIADRLAESRRTLSYIVSYTHGLRMIKFSISPSNPVGQLFVNFIRNHAADIIRLKTCMRHMQFVHFSITPFFLFFLSFSAIL